MAQEENTKAVIDNSGSNPIEAYDRGIKRLGELIRTLDNYVLKQPHKEFLAPDLWEFLEEYPCVRETSKSISIAAFGICGKNYKEM